MRQLCCDMCSRLPELSHIDMSTVAVSFSQARRNVSHGFQASLTPLRFEGGATTGRRKGRQFRCQIVRDESGRELLYILSFYLPRFLNHAFEEKLSTVVHELWHIGPQCDGDLRRHEGRCYAHGNSQRDYDKLVEKLAQKWLALDPPQALYSFLECDFNELVAEYGSVYGKRIPAPRLTEV